MSNWNEAVIREFHAKRGKGVGQFGDRLLLLTTTGTHSGEERTTPLGRQGRFRASVPRLPAADLATDSGHDPGTDRLRLK